MGRHKKEIVAEAKEILNEVKEDLQSVPMPSTKGRKPVSDSEKYPHCERCNSLIYCQPSRIDTNILTGKADYYRSAPRYIKLCDNCCKELSNIVEKWLIDGGCKTKYQLNQEKKQEEKGEN